MRRGNLSLPARPLSSAFFCRAAVVCMYLQNCYVSALLKESSRLKPAGSSALSLVLPQIQPARMSIFKGSIFKIPHAADSTPN